MLVGRPDLGLRLAAKVAHETLVAAARCDILVESALSSVARSGRGLSHAAELFHDVLMDVLSCDK